MPFSARIRNNIPSAAAAAALDPPFIHSKGAALRGRSVNPKSNESYREWSVKSFLLLLLPPSHIHSN